MTAVIDEIKLSFEEIWISSNLGNSIKFALMSEPAQNCENYFTQNYTKELFMLLKWPILVVSVRGKSRFSRFPPRKSFIASNCRLRFFPPLNRVLSEH